MQKKDFTLTSKFLLTLLAAGSAAAVFFPSPGEFRRRAFPAGHLFKNRDQMKSLLYYLVQKGLIKMEDKNHRRFVKLTSKGQLEALLAKARLPAAIKPKDWDGKWRVLVFDIPEGSRDKRNHFRYLLKQNGFKMLQASVFISPYPISREAVIYLKETGLINYIRILKVEEMDNDKDLKKYFGLN